VLEANILLMNRQTNDRSAVDLRAVGVRRGGRWLLSDITWAVPAGSVAAIIGPNGSGKSTLARVLSGYMFPTTGEVNVFGERYGSVDLNELRRSIRLVQTGGPYEPEPTLTAMQVVCTGADGTIGLFHELATVEIARAGALLKQVGLSAVADRAWTTLSSGERVRALVARAFLRPPKLLLLDELTAGLDLLAREQVLAALQQLSSAADHATTLLMITHHLEELLPSTSQVILLSHGSCVASGTPQNVLNDRSLSAAYECEVTVEVINGRYYPRVDPSAWDDLI
jgi:iron complex transport system ATP-binding protein